MDEKPEDSLPATLDQNISNTENAISFKKRPWRFIWSFLKDHRGELITGVLVAVSAFVSTARWDQISNNRQQRFEDQRFEYLQQIEDSRQEHQEILENTRYARQLSLANGPNPLSMLNLREADLCDLNLSEAKLSGTILTRAVLTGVRFERFDGTGGICYDSSTVWPEGYEVEQDPICHDII